MCSTYVQAFFSVKDFWEGRAVKADKTNKTLMPKSLDIIKFHYMYTFL